MMSLTLYLCRKNTFPGQMRCIFFLVSPRDREFPKTGHKMLAKWGIRLPNQFLSHNTLLQSKNQAKVAYFTKLMILIFWCPEEIRITNFTRMPPMHMRPIQMSWGSIGSYGKQPNRGKSDILTRQILVIVIHRRGTFHVLTQAREFKSWCTVS